CARATEGRDPSGSLSSTVTPAALGGYAKLHVCADNELSVTITVNRRWLTQPSPWIKPLSEGEGLSVGRGLDAVQLGVLTASGHQLFVAADLDHPRAIQHDDQVG